MNKNNSSIRDDKLLNVSGGILSAKVIGNVNGKMNVEDNHVLNTNVTNTTVINEIKIGLIKKN